MPRTFNPRATVCLFLALAVLWVPGPLAAGADSCAPRNLLADAEFATLDARDGESPWLRTQHSSAGSFRVSAEEGVLGIEKVGEEPWFVFSQLLKRKDLGGRTVRYSALLKLELTDPEPAHGFDYEAGMYLAAKNRSRRRIMRSAAEHQPNFGTADWFEVVLDFPLPAATAALDVGLIHRAGGTLWVRDPRLVFLDGGDCAEAQ